MTILVFNAGSATLKFALFDSGALSSPQLRGQAEHFGADATLGIHDGLAVTTSTVALADHAAAAEAIVDAIRGQRADLLKPPLVVAHRFVHGGGVFNEAIELDAVCLERLDRIGALAPLHMGPALAVARRTAVMLPAVPVGVFDTGFFSDLPAPAREYALPRDWVRRFGLRRYGFHGLAHRSLYEQYCLATGTDPHAARVVTLQLGQGCSAAAIAGGRPLDTSMGFTPLEGLIMGSRAGDLDPGLLLELLRQGISVAELDTALHRRSGLLGLSGSSADMRVLLAQSARSDNGARLAIDTFCHRLRKYLGAYLALLGGADAVVFGGGIGEHAAEIRARCLDGFGWAGLSLDAGRNEAGCGRISGDSSRVGAFVFSSDEERIIAADAHRLLHAGTQKC